MVFVALTVLYTLMSAAVFAFEAVMAAATASMIMVCVTCSAWSAAVEHRTS